MSELEDELKNKEKVIGNGEKMIKVNDIDSDDEDVEKEIKDESKKFTS